MGKIQVVLSAEAAAEFEELIGHRTFGDLAERYLRELTDFPPEAWGDIHQGWGGALFRSDNHVIFDIQGKLVLDTQGLVQGIKIVRFRLRRRS